MIRVGIVILSDRASRGMRADASGPLLEELSRRAGWDVEKKTVLADEADPLRRELQELIDDRGVDLVLTSGGTGLGPRDITPEVTAGIVEKKVNGLAEALRREGSKHTPTAALSRGTAGIRKQTLIINLPGSPRAIRQSWEVLEKTVPHAIEVLTGRAEECGREEITRPDGSPGGGEESDG